MLLAGGCLLAAFQVDASLLNFTRERSVGWSHWLAGRVSYWGDWYGVLGLGCGGWWWARRKGSSEWRRLFVIMGICAALAGIGANVVRSTTGRARPNAGAAPGWYGPAHGLRLAKSAREFQSFPSAHTSVVAGFFAPLGLAALRRRRPGRGLFAVAVAGTVLMAWARVWVGAHHFSDVFAASVLGWSIAGAVMGLRRFGTPGI